MDLCTHFNVVFGELLPLLSTHSTTSSLIRNRLVCREWNKVATKILLERGDLKIQFKLIFNQTQEHVPTFYSYRVKDLLESKCCMAHHKSASEDLSEGRTLSDFFRLVSSSSPPFSPRRIASSLPVNNFEFYFESRYLNQPQFVSFAQNYGPNVKTLTLHKFDKKLWCHKTMADFILRYMPNLQSLCLHVTATDYVVHNEPGRNRVNEALWPNACVSHKNLKCIEIIPNFDSYADLYPHIRRRFFCHEPSLPSKIVAPLLQSAPKLTRVSFQNPCIKNLVEILLPAKTNLLHITTLHLREYELFLQGQESLEKLVEAMTTNPQGWGLKCLRLSVADWPTTQDSWKKGTARIHRILEANSSTLNSLDLVDGAASILHNIPYLPILPKVTKLTVGLVGYGTPMHFVAGNPDDVLGEDESPRGLPLSVLLPNLETLDLRNFKGDGISDKWFPYWADELRQVKALKTSVSPYDSTCKEEPWERPKSYARSLILCPEVTSFYLYSQFHRISSVLTPLWGATQLTSLHIEFNESSDWNWSGPNDKHLDLESALTGLSKGKISAIYKNWQLTGRWERSKVGGAVNDKELKNLTSKSSLLNLQNLQKLKLEFTISSEIKPKMFVSGVSAKFGFDLIKNLEVSIIFNCNYLKKPQKKLAEWLQVHESLSSFPNVTVGLKEDARCCFTTSMDQ